MTTQVLIPAQTAAVTTKAEYDSSGDPYVFICADNLKSAETASLFFKVNGTYLPVSDLSGNALKLTTSIGSIRLDGGPVYAATKDLTAGACGVFVTLGARVP